MRAEKSNVPPMSCSLLILDDAANEKGKRDKGKRARERGQGKKDKEKRTREKGFLEALIPRLGSPFLSKS